MTIVRFLTMFLVVTTVLGLGTWYVGVRMGTDVVGKWRWLYWGGLITVVLLGPTGFMLMGMPQTAAWHRPLYVVAFLGLGMLSLLFAGVLVVDIMRLFGWMADKVSGWFGATPVTDHLLPVSPQRRVLLGRATRIAVLIAAHGLLIWSVRKAKQGAVVERVELPVKDLPESLEGFRIAQISDLHVCPNIRSDEVLRIVSQVNELNADMVAVTGDLADGQVAALKKDVAPLAGLKSRHGTFFVTGNHEYYSDLPGWMAEIRLLGMDILNNEHRVLSHDGTPILVAGVTDSREGGRFEGHESDPQKALSNAPECPYRIMLAHQPNSAYGAADLGFNLVLCGHTHGGQYFPYSSLVGLVMPFVEGLYKHNDTHVYTNRGTGYWGPPMRSKNSEITLLTLVRA